MTDIRMTDESILLIITALREPLPPMPFSPQHHYTVRMPYFLHEPH